MAKEKQEPYEFLSNLVLTLMSADRIFSNSFFISEFAVSPKTLGEIRRGEDMCIYQYVRVIRCMTKYLHLIIQMDMLLKELRIVLSSIVTWWSLRFRTVLAELVSRQNGWQ